MNFQSSGFLIFITVVFFLLLLLRKHKNSKKIALALAGYYFYSLFSIWFAALLFTYTLFFYFIALAIAQYKKRAFYNLIVWSAWCAPVLGLIFFKYSSNFIIELLSSLSPISDGVYDMNIVAPVGISFFTFQGIAYVMDVHKEKTKASRNFLDVLVFFSLFPSILSGPINRATTLIPQINTGGTIDTSRIYEGLYLILRGFAKKIIFADILAAQIVNPAFQNPEIYSTAYLLIALYAYTIQMYMDLSGYTDIARGIAKLIGFDLTENFHMPYGAVTLSEFWQKWHTSMSGFFRDYLFHSIGGSKTGNVYFNLFITFIAIGLWHGAGLNFIIYGILHGSVVAFERYQRTNRSKKGLPALNPHGLERLIRWFIIFNFIAFSRILFRSSDLSSAENYLISLFTSNAAPLDFMNATSLLIIIGLALHFIPEKFHVQTISLLNKIHVAYAAACIFIFALFLILFSQGESSFIYFNF